MRLSDLRNKPVRTVGGDSLGRVHEVHCEKGQLVALIVGAGSFVESLTGRNHGRRIPWDRVRKVDAKQVTVISDRPQPPPPAKKSSAARSRQGTRPASARRSRR